MDSIIIQKSIMWMSPSDWYEFISKHKHHAKSLLPDLRKFVQCKYIYEEKTHKKWGQLCDIAEYPLGHRPYKEDEPAAKQHSILIPEVQKTNILNKHLHLSTGNWKDNIFLHI